TRLLDVDVREEEDHAFAREPEHRIVHAQRALDVVDDLRELGVAFESREADHHRPQSVLAGEDLGALHELAESAGVPGVADLHLRVHRKTTSPSWFPGGRGPPRR